MQGSPAGRRFKKAVIAVAVAGVVVWIVLLIRLLAPEL
jgi:hypothetical protein